MILSGKKTMVVLAWTGWNPWPGGKSSIISPELLRFFCVLSLSTRSISDLHGTMFKRFVWMNDVPKEEQTAVAPRDGQLLLRSQSALPGTYRLLPATSGTDVGLSHGLYKRLWEDHQIHYVFLNLARSQFLRLKASGITICYVSKQKDFLKLAATSIFLLFTIRLNQSLLLPCSSQRRGASPRAAELLQKAARISAIFVCLWTGFMGSFENPKTPKIPYPNWEACKMEEYL